MKLIWSLGNVVGNDEPHSDFVYDMFYLSIALAKDLGYQTAFYGTHNSFYNIKPYVNESYDYTWLDYRLYDDIKVNIWYERNDNFMTIDGDVFLYNRLEYDEYLSRGLAIANKKIELIYEKKQTLTPQAEAALKVFNSFNPKQIIPEWDFNNRFSICTGIIGWGKNSHFKKYYCESYSRLRNWFLENEKEMKAINPYLSKDSSVASHIICEHLLYQLANYYNIPKTEIISNSNNKYWHVQGPDKFRDIDFINNIGNFVKQHKSNNFKVKTLHDNMLMNGILKKPLLFRETKKII